MLNKLKIDIIENEDKSFVEFVAYYNGFDVGIALLEENEVSLFTKGGKPELDLKIIDEDILFENEGIISFLMQQIIYYVDLNDRVLTVKTDALSTTYLLRRNFQIEHVSNYDVFVYGEDYKYKLENIHSVFYQHLDSNNLSKEDKNNLNRGFEGNIYDEPLEETAENIIEEFEDNLRVLIHDANSSLEDIGLEPMLSFDIEEEYEDEEYEDEHDLPFDFCSDFLNNSHNPSDEDLEHIYNLTQESEVVGGFEDLMSFFHFLENTKGEELLEDEDNCDCFMCEDDSLTLRELLCLEEESEEEEIGVFFETDIDENIIREIEDSFGGFDSEEGIRAFFEFVIDSKD